MSPSPELKKIIARNRRIVAAILEGKKKSPAPLTKLGIRRLLKAKESILAEPKLFEMSTWIEPAYRQSEEACGTAACIGGRVVLNAGFRVHPMRGYKLKRRQPARMRHMMNRLGINLTTSIGATATSLLTGMDGGLAPFTKDLDRLFVVSQWPPLFRGSDEDGERFYELPPRRRALVAAARIDHFIATGD